MQQLPRRKDSAVGVIGKVAGYIIVLLILAFVIGLLALGVQWVWGEVF